MTRPSDRPPGTAATRPAGPPALPEGVLARAAAAWSRFWFEQPIEPAQIATFRFLFFGLLAIDSWLKIGFAAGYGAGGFNIAHVAWLDRILPVPDARVIVLLWLAQSYLAARIALGGTRHWLGVLLAVLYGSTYLASQLDSWQHHYLLALLLIVLAWVRWNRPRQVTWPFQLVRAQLSLVYFWAAVTKLDPRWLDGTVVALSRGPIGDVQAWAAASLGVSPGVFWATLAWSGLFMEIFMCVAVLVPGLRGAAVVTGVVFHLTIELLLGIRIALFSWYMASLLVLIMPPEWWRRIAAAWPRSLPTSLPHLTLSGGTSWGVLAGAVLAGSLALNRIPLDGMPVLAALTAAIALLGGLATPAASRIRLAAGHLVACVCLLALHFGTDAVVARYVEAANDAGTRGDTASAILAARLAVDASPGYAATHRLLGDTLRLAGRDDEAILAYDDALILGPERDEAVRTQAARAIVLRRLGRFEESYQAAEEAIRLDPETDLLPAGDPRLEEYRRRTRQEARTPEGN